MSKAKEKSHQQQLNWANDARRYLDSLSNVKRTSATGASPAVFDCGCQVFETTGIICERHKAALGKP